MNVPDQIFEERWKNYAMQMLFDYNKEAAHDAFCEVWNLAVEECIVEIREIDHNLVENVKMLLCKK